MNKIKSLFIGIFPMVVMAIAIYAIYQLVVSGLNFVWLGTALVTLPIMMFFGRVMLFKNMARTTAHFPVITTLAIAGLAIAVYGFLKSDFADRVAIVLAGIGFILFMAYNFWYSNLDREVNPALQVGQQLPEFDVVDTSGQTVYSSTFKGSPTIIMFFRGNWCPLCMAQIKEIAGKYKEISNSGARVALIAPQPEKNTQTLANKFNVPFMFLSDVGNRAAQALGIVMENGLPAGMEMLGYDHDTVLPTVIITDAEANIIYSDLTTNYRIRPEPDDFIKVLNDNAQPA
jgi:peroxiredoxin